MSQLHPTLIAGQNVLTTDGEFGTIVEIRTRGWVAVEIAGTVVNRRAKDLVVTQLAPMAEEPEAEDSPATNTSGPLSLAAAILTGADRPATAPKATSKKFDGEHCPRCGSTEIWAGAAVGGVVTNGDQCGCHECGWTLINTRRRNGIVPADYLERYQRYTRVAEDGVKSRSVDNGDAVARAFREMNLEQGYEYVAATIGTSPEALRAQYGHLNVGQQRMNIGNRLRAFLRRQAAAAATANA